jgi:hypothetical protein
MRARTSETQTPEANVSARVGMATSRFNANFNIFINVLFKLLQRRG